MMKRAKRGVWTKARRKARSLAYKLMYKEHPEIRKKIDAGVTSFWKKHPEIRKKYSKQISKFWTKKERAEQSRRKKKLFRKYPLTESVKQKIDQAVTRWWNEHPNIKKQKSIELQNFFLKHPDDFAKKFSNSKKNPFYPHLKTKLGLVRSKPEQIIADYLIKNNIPAKYESKTLILDGYACVPDFYLPKQNCYIEFYGGYPGSYKKKVLKNRLYKKHKIKVISIQPYELRHLDSVIRF